MKKPLLYLTFIITLLFTNCSIASLYNLKSNEALLIPMSETVYILKVAYTKDVYILRINGKYIFNFFDSNKKVMTGVTTFLVKSNLRGQKGLAQFKLNIQARKVYRIYARSNGDSMFFSITVDGKTILEKQGVRHIDLLNSLSD